MLWLKACPKCDGAVEYQQDQNGPYLHCMNCGMYEDLCANVPFTLKYDRKHSIGAAQEGPHLPENVTNYIGTYYRNRGILPKWYDEGH